MSANNRNGMPSQAGVNLPATIDTTKASLPATYEAAKAALAKCEQIDECKDWADKAEALAVYAKQANDPELRQMADRIQARAMRRAGELLQEIAPATGAKTDLQPRDGADPKLTRAQAAEDAGLSERQRKTALRVSKVPGVEFEKAVESPTPPTVTALAALGKVKRAAPADPPIIDTDAVELMMSGATSETELEDERVERLRAAYKSADFCQAEWIDATLELADALHAARDTFPDDKAFAYWLIDNGLEEYMGRLGSNERAGLIAMSRDGEKARIRLEENHIGFACDHRIWVESDETRKAIEAWAADKTDAARASLALRLIDPLVGHGMQALIKLRSRCPRLWW